jgi:hypothetical protein
LERRVDRPRGREDDGDLPTLEPDPTNGATLVERLWFLAHAAGGGLRSGELIRSGRLAREQLGRDAFAATHPGSLTFRLDIEMHPLLKTALEKAAIPGGRWILKQVGLQWVVDRVQATVEGIGHRQKAILKARSMHDGRFGSVIIEDRVRWVVYSGEEPRAVFPGIRGDIAQEMVGYDTSRLRSPDELNTARTRTWAAEQLGSMLARVRPKDREAAADAAEASPAGVGNLGPLAGVAPIQERPPDTSPGNEPDNHGLNTGLGTVAQDAGHKVFDALIGRMPELLDALSSRRAQPMGEHFEIPATPGIYLFSEGPTPRYVGNTQNLRQRLRQHTATSSRENQAALAWRLALQDARSKGLDPSGTRKEIESDPEFAEIFRGTRERVARMDVRFIEIEDPVTRTVFEIYAAQALGTEEHNSFETH